MTKLTMLLFVSLSTYYVKASMTNVRGGTSSSPAEDGGEGMNSSPPPLEPPDEGYLIAMQFSDDPYLGQDKLELVLSGKFMLSDVHMGRNAGEATKAHFCEFDFERQQEDPSLAPRYIDLYSQTQHCQEHYVTLDLHEVAHACRKRDASSASTMHSIKPSAFIFHQPKSGSSLLTNMLAANQPGTRVISEPIALSEIVACQKCGEEEKSQALQDAMYLLGRTATTTDEKKDESLFVKLSSASTIGLSIVRNSFPDTKWVFMYRDADTILQKLMNSRIDRRSCAHKKRRNPGAAMANFLISKEKNVSNLETDEQVCAAFMATNMAVVQQELALDDTVGRLVDYEDVTSQEGIEELFDYLEVAEPNWGRIQDQRKKRANNGRGQDWSGEDELLVSHEVQSATSEFELSS
jgi:hypothetical protein